MPASNVAYTDVASLTLPAGNFFVTAAMEFRTTGVVGLVVQCVLNPTYANVLATIQSAPERMPMSLQGMSPGGTVTLSCTSFLPDASVHDVHLDAIQVGTLH